MIWQWALGAARYGGCALAFVAGIGAALLVMGPMIEARGVRDGVRQGEARAIAAARDALDKQIARQIKDKIDAEINYRHRGDDADGVRCGPSTRDCHGQ